MPKRKLYEYQGKICSIEQLADFGGIPVATMRSRLYKGWSIENAINTPCFKQPGFENTSAIIGKTLQVVFRSWVPSVSNAMQPQLNKLYTTSPVCAGRGKGLAKPYCIIRLESGLPLIVYPDEFEIVGEVNIAS